MEFEVEAELKGFTPAEVFEWHARPGGLERLLPAWGPARFVAREGGIEDGSRAILQLRWGPLRSRWMAVHTECQPGRGFTDVQVEGPFRSWAHAHRFLASGSGGTRMVDRIECRLPLGGVGEALVGSRVERQLRRTLAWRRRRLQFDLERHAAWQSRGSARIAVSGASGLVGRALCAFLAAGGHDVRPLVRRSPDPGVNEVYWNPATGEVDREGLEGTDIVVHLAGENLLGRWTAAKMRRIRESRVRGTELLAGALAAMERPPAALVCASAIGFYGDGGAQAVDESDPPGQGFLADVCRQWEAATEPARRAGIRVVRLRIGVVLTPAGGALGAMLPAFRLGGGAVLGSGEQVMSWISLEDLVGIFQYAVFDEQLEGAVNAVAPGATTQREFARTLGSVLGRPVPWRVPAGMLRALLGRLAEEMLLSGVRVRPARLEEASFHWRFPRLEAALRWELGRSVEVEAMTRGTARTEEGDR